MTRIFERKMFVYIFCLFVWLCGASEAWKRGDLEKYGPFQLALHSKLIKCDHNRTLDLDVSNIDVYFYDFKNFDVETYPISTAANSIISYRIDLKKKFIFFVGGYKSSINRKTEERVRDAFRNLPDSYLIIFDHSTYTNNKQGNIKSYERSVKYVHYIGRAVGQFLADLRNGGVLSKNMHCIGHSLGSQMLASAGETFFLITGEKISRITALDPAGPCFSNSLIEYQIRSGVAEYVEVYHCNAGGLGTTSVLGDVDFFINKNGESQPHCGTPLIPGLFDSPKAAKCSHKTCVQMYTATVSHPGWFPAQQCDNYKDFKHQACSINGRTIAGFWNPGYAKGVYYVSTEDYDIDDLTPETLQDSD